MEERDIESHRALQQELGERLGAARRNLERALVSGAWQDPAVRQQGYDLTWRLDALISLNTIAGAFAAGYPATGGRPSAAVLDATQRFFADLDGLVEKVAALNASLGDVLHTSQGPAPSGTHAAAAGQVPPVKED